MFTVILVSPITGFTYQTIKKLIAHRSFLNGTTTKRNVWVIVDYQARALATMLHYVLLLVQSVPLPLKYCATHVINQATLY